MSTIFQIRCETCEIDGPKIRRSGSTTLLQRDLIAGPFDEQYLRRSQKEWTLFLGEHEFHNLRLKTGP